MTTITGHEARDRLDELIDGAAESHQAVTIIGKRHDAILIAAADWISLQAALQRAGEQVDFGQVSREPEAKAARTSGKPAE